MEIEFLQYRKDRSFHLILHSVRNIRWKLSTRLHEPETNPVNALLYPGERCHLH